MLCKLNDLWFANKVSYSDVMDDRNLKNKKIKLKGVKNCVASLKIKYMWFSSSELCQIFECRVGISMSELIWKVFCVYELVDPQIKLTN